MNLSSLAKHRSLTTEEKCIAYLEKMRWPTGVRCPICGNSSISRFQTKGRSGKVRHLYQCLDRPCRYQFSATTGTIFHDSHLPLNKWFRAISLLSDEKKPMSINQLRLSLGVQYKTAAHLAGRIRLAMENGTIELSSMPSSAPLTTSRADIGSNPPSTSKSAALPGAKPSSAYATRRVPSMEERREETAALLGQITNPVGKDSVSSTAIDNMLSMFVSVAQMSVRPPLFFAKYLRDKVLP